MIVRHTLHGLRTRDLKYRKWHSYMRCMDPACISRTSTGRNVSWQLEACEGRGTYVSILNGLDDRGSRVQFLAGAGNFSLHHRVQNGSGAHPASYPMGTRGCFPGGKAARARS
jgi:hypothetical protein